MDIASILERNPWRKNREAIREDDYIKEALSRKHKNLYKFERNENLILIGPRRSGKTTYFKLLIYDLLINKKINPEEVLFISCEILKDHREIIEILKIIKSKYFFFDEITFVDGWEKAIKYSLDQGLLKDKTILITGSSTAFLRRETFPGRKIKLEEFLPIDFLKFCRIFGSKDLKNKLIKLIKLKTIEDLLYHSSEIFNLFMKYIECGGFPKPMFQLMEEGSIKEENYEAIYSWFRGDMLKLGKSEEISKALISRLLETMTTFVSYNSLGNYIGISHRIVREYIEAMQQLLYLDFCYQIDLQKNIPIFRKEKKVYVTDPFILRTFEKKILGKSVVNESKMAEMIVFNMLKRRDNKVYVIKSNGETDFYADKMKIEVKWTENVAGKEDTIVLSKKKYNPENKIFPLYIFILHYLASKEISTNN